MKTDIHIWQYLAQFFLEWEKFRKTIVKKIKIILWSNFHVLLTVHLSTFISVFNQLDAKNFVSQ